jgi:hypothetical protein
MGGYDCPKAIGINISKDRPFFFQTLSVRCVCVYILNLILKYPLGWVFKF